MNVVALVGRLTKDPDLRYTPSGVATTQFTLAVDDPFAKGEKKADFLPIVTWKQTAEACANYLKKGRLCAVEGRISTRSYQKNDGTKVNVTEIIASNVRFLERGEGGQDVHRQKQPQSDPFSGSEPFDVSEDNLPF